MSHRKLQINPRNSEWSSKQALFRHPPKINYLVLLQSVKDYCQGNTSLLTLEKYSIRIMYREKLMLGKALCSNEMRPEMFYAVVGFVLVNLTLVSVLISAIFNPFFVPIPILLIICMILLCFKIIKRTAVSCEVSLNNSDSNDPPGGRAYTEAPTRHQLNKLKEALGLEEGSLQYKRKGDGVYLVHYQDGKHKWTHLGSWPELKEKLEG